MKKKYFVLRDYNDTNLSNLSYYDSEKKFKQFNSQPKRVIYLKDCFSINRKIDGKHKYVIALYTKDDCFSTVLDDEPQLRDWLDALIDAQALGVDFRTGHNMHYDHVWQVCINRNGLGQTRNMNGTHRLALTQSTLYIVKVEPQTDSPDVYEFPLISIRRCGHTSSTFFIELGRSSSIGPGELWIQADDSAIAQNMHEVILSAMRSSKNHEEFGPSSRPRSASTSDKPISTRRPTQTSHTSQSIAMSFGTSYSSSASTNSASVLGTSVSTKSSIRERCDSMPSRSRTTSESDSTTGHDTRSLWTPTHYQTTDRIHGSSTFHSRTLSYSPPSCNPLSASSTACSTDSAGSSLSIDDFDSGSHCLTPISDHHSGLHNSLIPSEPPISEEDAQIDDYLSMSPMSATSTGAQSDVRSRLNLDFRLTNASNSSPITSPSVNSTTKMLGHSVKEDISPYMPMSPAGSIGTDSISSSRRSSGLEKHLNTETISSSEYMPMMSTSQEIRFGVNSEEYLNMAPLSGSLPKSHCPTNQNNSLIKEEYHLEKVKSYFSPTVNDELDSFEYIPPPVRAYSIGSRPPTQTMVGKYNQKSKQLLPKSGQQTPEQVEEEYRIRAFSMGSHANTRERRLAAKKQALLEAQLGAPTAPIVEAGRHAKKASSAPVLSPAAPRKRSATVGSRPVFNRPSPLSTSADTSDTDLMEIDYSKSMQSKQLREKIEDRIKMANSTATTAGHRQRSNSRSSTSSSGIGSTSTTSPSITSSMSELTIDRKRDLVSTSNTIVKSSGEDTNQTVVNRSVQSARDPTNEYLQVFMQSPNTETTKLPSLNTSHRPIISQVSQQQLPTVPSIHSSGLQQSHSKTLPTNQTNITKSEPIAQKTDQKSNTKTSKNSLNTTKDDNKDSGDYVCLDMSRSATDYVPQSTNTTAEDKPSLNTLGLNVPKVVDNIQTNESFDTNKISVFMPQIDIKIKTNSQNTQQIHNEIGAKTMTTKLLNPDNNLGNGTGIGLMAQTSSPLKTSPEPQNPASNLLPTNKCLTTLTPNVSSKSLTERNINSGFEAIATQTVANSCENVFFGSGLPSRPSSVSSEKELNYASLDLAPASPAMGSNTSDSSGDDHNKSLSTHSLAAKCGPQLILLATNTGCSVPSLSSTCSTALVGPLPQCCGSQELLYSSTDSSNQLSYAEIDFGIANKKITKS